MGWDHRSLGLTLAPILNDECDKDWICKAPNKIYWHKAAELPRAETSAVGEPDLGLKCLVV